MPETPELLSWASARAVAADLALTGVDPLDVAAATVARRTLLRRFILDAIVVFSIVALVASLVLIVVRAVSGGDPLGGRELWITTAALILLLATLVVRAALPARAAAYEKAWSAFTAQIWPGAKTRDDLGAARLAFVRRASELTTPGADVGVFPTSAPGGSR